MEKQRVVEQVRHIVIFRFKDGAEAEKVEAFTRAFRALQEKIPGIVGFEHGENTSPEGLGRGLNHVYLLTFENAARRDAYLPHPEHKKFGEFIGELGIHEDVFVVDYHPQP
jgi:hypothetical protein